MRSSLGVPLVAAACITVVAAAPPGAAGGAVRAATAVGLPPASATPGQGTPARGAAFDPRQLVLVREALQVVSTYGDQEWPGWSRVPLPVLLIDATAEYLLNLPPTPVPPVGFEPLADVRLDDKPVYRRPRRLQRSLRTAFPIDGIPVAVVGAWRPSEEPPTEWVLTLVEQWFKVLQLRRGEQSKVAALELAAADLPAWQVKYAFPFEDPDVDNALLLLGQSLYSFWQRGSQLPRSGQRTFAADVAWAALQNLRTVLELKYGPEAWRYAQMTAWREGVARYTAVHVARRLAHDEPEGRYRPVPGFDRLPEFRPYGQVWEEIFSARFWLIRTSGAGDRQDSTTFHAIGHGLAELLDVVNPEWKGRYFRRDVWLDDLVAEVLATGSRNAAER